MTMTETQEGRLLARPHRLTREPSGPGVWPLELGGRRDGLLLVPRGYREERPAPLAVMLHGAGGHAHQSLEPWREWADAAGVLLLAPESRGPTWDIITGDGYGPDVSFLDAALAHVFERYAVDARHLALEGFSDGGSYALSLGLTNGDLFTHVVAFSPGFLAPAARHGAPELFIAHGVKDTVLRIDPCSRRIVPRVEREGYRVRYHEFDGGHTVPEDLAREALAWFTTPAGG